METTTVSLQLKTSSHLQLTTRLVLLSIDDCVLPAWELNPTATGDLSVHHKTDLEVDVRLETAQIRLRAATSGQPHSLLADFSD